MVSLVLRAGHPGMAGVGRGPVSWFDVAAPEEAFWSVGGRCYDPVPPDEVTCSMPQFPLLGNTEMTGSDGAPWRRAIND